MQDHFSVFLLLLNNISVFVVLVVGYSFLIDHLQTRKPILRQMVLGVYFGLVVLLSMNVKIPVMEGVIVDQRNALIVLSGAFGGPISALLSGLIAAGYRAYLGGLGVPAGIFGIVLSATVGCGLYLLRWKGNTVLNLFLGGIATVALTAPGFLLVGDVASGFALMQRMILPWGGAVFIGVFIGGLLLSREDRRRIAERERQATEAQFKTLYDDSVIPILDMDFSDVVQYFRTLRGRGVTDIESFLAQGPPATDGLDSLVVVRHANRAAQRLYGANAIEDLQGRFDGRFGPKRGGLHPRLARGIWHGDASIAFEAEHRTFAGDTLTVSVSLPWPGSIDAPIEGFRSLPVTILDITAQKKAERARDAALLSAEKANTAKSEFLAAMSHELRTPLNAILGFSEIIQQQMLGPLGDPKYVEYAHDIHSSGTLLLDLVNDILDVAAIEAGRKELQFSTVDLNELVDECLGIIEHRAREAGIDLRKVLDDAADNTVVADRRALQQVLLNLLTNAVKYTPRGGSVAVSALHGTAITEITVSDTGCGIPQDRIDDVTNAFVRRSENPHVAQEGWGLGLAIAKSLVELHQGNIRIESTVGKGTSVHITLPRRIH